jgi:hypothetical protein
MKWTMAEIILAPLAESYIRSHYINYVGTGSDLFNYLSID